MSHELPTSESIEWAYKNCRLKLTASLDGGETIACPRCGSEFDVTRVQPAGRVAFSERSGPKVTLPLRLPSGSIRALVALALGGWDNAISPVWQSALSGWVSFYFDSRW